MFPMLEKYPLDIGLFLEPIKSTAQIEGVQSILWQSFLLYLFVESCALWDTGQNYVVFIILLLI